MGRDKGTTRISKIIRKSKIMEKIEGYHYQVYTWSKNQKFTPCQRGQLLAEVLNGTLEKWQELINKFKQQNNVKKKSKKTNSQTT